MAKKKNEEADPKELTGEELATQLGINYEQLMVAQANIREIRVELNRRTAELKEKPKG